MIVETSGLKDDLDLTRLCNGYWHLSSNSKKNEKHELIEKIPSSCKNSRC